MAAKTSGTAVACAEDAGKAIDFAKVAARWPRGRETVRYMLVDAKGVAANGVEDRLDDGKPPQVFVSFRDAAFSLATHQGGTPIAGIARVRIVVESFTPFTD
ncbi:MAG: hypothetical protein U0575_07440 [Phycisphaerales bacterium]